MIHEPHAGVIQAEQLGFETELVPGRIGTAQAVHFCEQVFEKGHRPGIIGIGKGGTGHIFQPPVIQAASGGGQTTQPVAHGAPCRKPNESHHGELLLKAEPARRRSCFVPVFKFLKNMSGNQR